jgi:hypothetical protein
MSLPTARALTIASQLALGHSCPEAMAWRRPSSPEPSLLASPWATTLVRRIIYGGCGTISPIPPSAACDPSNGQ